MDPRIGKLAADGKDRIDAIHVRHLQIHQCDIGPSAAKAFYRLPARGCLPYDGHVGLGSDERCDPRTEQRMIIDGKYSDYFGIRHDACVLFARKKRNLSRFTGSS